MRAADQVQVLPTPSGREGRGGISYAAGGKLMRESSPVGASSPGGAGAGTTPERGSLVDDVAGTFGVYPWSDDEVRKTQSLVPKVLHTLYRRAKTLDQSKVQLAQTAALWGRDRLLDGCTLLMSVTAASASTAGRVLTRVGTLSERVPLGYAMLTPLRLVSDYAVVAPLNAVNSLCNLVVSTSPEQVVSGAQSSIGTAEYHIQAAIDNVRKLQNTTSTWVQGSVDGALRDIAKFLQSWLSRGHCTIPEARSKM